MKKTIKEVIETLAKKQGYPHRKLNAEEYNKVLKEAHEIVYHKEQAITPLQVEGFTGGSWQVWEDYERDGKPEKNPCFSVRTFGGGTIICKTHQNIDEPPASKNAEANARLIAAAPEMYKALQGIVDYLVCSESFMVEDVEEGNENAYSDAIAILNRIKQ